MPRKRANQERRQREKLSRSALRQATKRFCKRALNFALRVPLRRRVEAEQPATARSDPQAVSETTDEDLLQTDGGKFDKGLAFVSFRKLIWSLSRPCPLSLNRIALSALVRLFRPCPSDICTAVYALVRLFRQRSSDTIQYNTKFVSPR